MELAILLLTILSIMGFGILPVLFQVKKENSESPWAFVQVEEKEEMVTQFTAATQTSDVDIPLFNTDEPLPFDELEEYNAFMNSGNADNDYTKVSFPSEEVWANLENIRTEMVDNFSMIADDSEELLSVEKNEIPEEYLPTLTKTQYNAIASKFGEKVANLITCTPYKATFGSQVMIGQFFKETNSIQFDGDWVELSNEIPKQEDGEFVIVKGSFIENGQFFVQHSEDPQMIEAGYDSNLLSENIAN